MVSADEHIFLKGDYVKVTYQEMGLIVPGRITDVKPNGTYEVNLFVCDMSDDRRFESTCIVTKDAISAWPVVIISKEDSNAG